LRAGRWKDEGCRSVLQCVAVCCFFCSELAATTLRAGEEDASRFASSSISRASMRSARDDRSSPCCSVLQCVAVCCNVSMRSARNDRSSPCCSVLQYVAMYCSVLQCFP